MRTERELSPDQHLIRLQRGIDYAKQGSEIVSISDISHTRVSDGIVHRYGLVTAAGYAYCGTVSEPHISTSDIPIISTDAWWTSPRGHNEHTDRASMHDGLWSIRLSNEGSYHPLVPPIPKREMSLVGTAAAALAFSRYASNSLFPDRISAKYRTAIGESKGGMEGQGIVALAPYYNQEVLMADFTAPCIPKKIKPEQMGKLFEQFISEPGAVLRLAGRLATDVLVNYPATIDLNPYSVAHQIIKGKAVFSGDAGKLAQLVKKNQFMHITTFNGDFASMPSQWSKLYSTNPNAHITPLDGQHLTLADPQTKAYIRARQRAFRELYITNGSRMQDERGNALFTCSDVLDMAHQYAAEYLSPLPKGRIQWIFRVLTNTERTNNSKVRFKNAA